MPIASVFFESLDKLKVLFIGPAGKFSSLKGWFILIYRLF